MATPDQRIVLTLCGENAKRGVALDGLETFIDEFRRALREFERTLSAREHEVGRMGQPGGRSKAATGFRLVHFKIGSGIAELEPIELDGIGEQLAPTEPASSQNLRLLLEAVRDRRPMSPRVVDALDGARKALGGDGSFGVEFASRKGSTVYVDKQQIERLEAAASYAVEPREMMVSGMLHLIETEQPGKVEIRATDGVNWTATYDPSLKPTVLRLVDSVIRANGVGAITAHNRGQMELRAVELLPKFEQTDLFTREQIPTAELERQQGISRPQGLVAFQDPDWVDDEASRDYLAMVLDES